MRSISDLEWTPVILLGTTIAIVWFYTYMLGPLFDGWTATLVVVGASAITWVVVYKLFFRRIAESPSDTYLP